MNPYLTRLLDQQEVLSRPKNPQILTPEFEAQNKFILDPARLKCALTTRRSGKSMGCGVYAVKVALEHPGCNILILGLTRGSVRTVFWKDIFKKLNKQFDLGADFNGTYLTMTFPNGSVIRMAGVDDSPDEADKLLGAKYKLIILDEAASYTQDLTRIVYQTLLPTTIDERGTICIVGTPGDVAKGLFFEVSTYSHEGRKWSVHKWNASDNPYMKEQWEEELKEMLETNPRIQDTPWFKRMCLGEWVTDTNNLIYRLCEWNIAPRNPLLTSYVLSIDLGFNDASAFVVGAYNTSSSDKLQVIDSYKASEMDVTDVADKIREFQTKYDLDAILVDPASKQVVEELKRRYQLPLRSAEKSDKMRHVEMVNAEFKLGRLEITPNQTELLSELRGLIRDPRSDKWAEHPACENHLCFVSGTQISTPQGERNIEDLKVGDSVLSSGGTRKIISTMKSLSKTLTLTLSNGTTITTTPDHPFYTDKGLVPAKDLLCQTLNPIQKFKHSMEEITIDQEKKSIFVDSVGKQENPYTYTETFTSSMLGQFHRDITFTMPMGIHQIIQSKISGVCPLKSTTRNTVKPGLRQGLKTLGFYIHQKTKEKQLNGIPHPKESNGIESMVDRLGRPDVLKKSKLCARNAGFYTKKRRERLIKPDAVVTTVMPTIEKNQGLMTKHVNVLGVTGGSESIGMPNDFTVISVKEEGVREVFNITVEIDHNYFANGVLVSNCDSLLYMVRHVKNYNFTEPTKKSIDPDVLAKERKKDFLKRQIGQRETPWWKR